MTHNQWNKELEPIIPNDFDAVEVINLKEHDHGIRLSKPKKRHHKPLKETLSYNNSWYFCKVCREFKDVCSC